MNSKHFLGPGLWMLAAVLLPLAAAGCQSTVGGQTLPSAWYLDDDVQYFPAGPEFKLSRTVQALEEYRIEQQAIDEGLIAPGVP